MWKADFKNGRRASTGFAITARRGEEAKEVIHHPSHSSMANKTVVHAHLGDRRGLPTPPANCNTVTTHQLSGDDSLRDPMTTADSGQIPKMTQHGKETRRSCSDLNVTIHCYRK